jgi:transposase-like protein
MKKKFSRSIAFQCPYIRDEVNQANDPECAPSPNSHRIVRNGFYRRKSDCKRIPRFYCLGCRKSFSSAYFSPCYRQKKRTVNHGVHELHYSGVSQRRLARLLGINRKTVVRKLIFLGVRAHLEHQRYLQMRLASGKQVAHLQFDEMETFERSKCLPLSIALAVEADTRKILGYRVAVMPAKGPLASISRRKYGPRADERPEAARSLFSEIAPLIHPKATITSDQNPKYPNWIKPHFPKVKHIAVKGRRGCVVGQGELKSGGFDPLFSLNHTAAMLRANINRLFRRTWCTTKRIDRLSAHIALYVQYHNQVLT